MPRGLLRRKLLAMTNWFFLRVDATGASILRLIFGGFIYIVRAPGLFFQKVDRAGGAVLAIELRVSALDTFFAQINAIFFTTVNAFGVGMIGARIHGSSA